MTAPRPPCLLPRLSAPRRPCTSSAPNPTDDGHRTGACRRVQARSRPDQRAGSGRRVQAWWHAERGSASVELTLIAPLLILLLVVVGVLVHRGVTARIELDTAAHQGARAAALARTPPAARQAATTAAHEALTTAGPECLSTDVAVDTSRWRPSGTVVVTVSCRVDLAAAGVAGLGGQRVLTTTAVEPLDSFRSTDNSTDNSSTGSVTDSTTVGIE